MRMESSHQSSMRSLQKKRTTNFREDETKLLIQLWGSPLIQNKLYLTHRKEPVMRLLAANMQQRGFYRTPDEIKTRIRNLKCLYHRIKRTVQSGAGIGTVDPDWPHYKAMDKILSKQFNQKKDIYKDNVFEGPRCEDIKQEIDDIDINDDMESFTTNSMGGSEFEEEQMPLPPALIPAPNKENIATKKQESSTRNQYPATKNLPKLLPNLTLPLNSQNSVPNNNNNNKQGTLPTIPFPLLILNGVPPQAQASNNNNNNNNTTNNDKINNNTNSNKNNNKNDSNLGHVLKELLEVQRENLAIERQRLELEKQRLEFERLIGSQLIAMGPVLGSILQKVVSNNETELPPEKEKNGKKRPNTCDIELLKDSKILKSLLSEGIKKYMMGEEESGHSSDEKDN